MKNVLWVHVLIVTLLIGLCSTIHRVNILEQDMEELQVSFDYAEWGE